MNGDRLIATRTPVALDSRADGDLVRQLRGVALDVDHIDIAAIGRENPLLAPLESAGKQRIRVGVEYRTGGLHLPSAVRLDVDGAERAVAASGRETRGSLERRENAVAARIGDVADLLLGGEIHDR